MSAQLFQFEALFQTARDKLADSSIPEDSFSRELTQEVSEVKTAASIVGCFPGLSCSNFHLDTDGVIVLELEEQSSEVDARKLAQAVAVATGLECAVNCGELKVSVDPGVLGVSLPGNQASYYDFDNALEAVERSTLDTFVDGSSASDCLDFREIGTKLEQASDKYGLLNPRIEKKSDDYFEVIIGNQVSSLGEKWFLDFLKEVRNWVPSSDQAIVRLECGIDSVFDLVSRTLGLTCPWQIVKGLEADSFVITLPASVRNPQVNEVARYINYFKSQTGTNVIVEVDSEDTALFSTVAHSNRLVPSEELIEITTSEIESKVRPYYFPQRVEVLPYSNIANVSCIASTEIISTRASTPIFVRYIPAVTAEEISQASIVKALEVLAREGRLVRPQVVVNEEGFELVHHTPFTQETRPGLNIDKIISEAAVATGCKIIVRREFDKTDFYNRISDELGSWERFHLKSYIPSSGQLSLRAHRPHRIPVSLIKTLKDDFKVNLIVERNPLKRAEITVINPSIVKAPEHSREDIISDLEDLHEVAPLGLGAKPIIELEGNRYILYCKTKNLPEAYLNNLWDSFRILKQPLEIAEDVECNKASELPVIEDILERTISDTLSLHDVYLDKGVLVAECHNLASSRTELIGMVKSWESQLAECIAYPVRIKILDTSPAVKRLVEYAYGARRNFLSAVTNEDGSTASLNSILDIHDFYLKEVRGGISRRSLTSKKNRSVSYEDLFTIDPKGTKSRDDAYSVRFLPNGHALIGVHGFDISDLVKYGSSADQYGLNNLKSVYSNLNDPSIARNLVQRLYPRNILKHFGFKEGRLCPTLSFYFEIDGDLNFVGFNPKTHGFIASTIKLNKAYSRADLREISSGRPDERSAELKLLIDFAEAYLAKPDSELLARRPMKVSNYDSSTLVVQVLNDLYNRSLATYLDHNDVSYITMTESDPYTGRNLEGFIKLLGECSIDYQVRSLKLDSDYKYKKLQELRAYCHSSGNEDLVERFEYLLAKPRYHIDYAVSSGSGAMRFGGAPYTRALDPIREYIAALSQRQMSYFLRGIPVLPKGELEHIVQRVSGHWGRSLDQVQIFKLVSAAERGQSMNLKLNNGFVDFVPKR